MFTAKKKGCSNDRPSGHIRRKQLTAFVAIAFMLMVGIVVMVPAADDAQAASGDEVTVNGTPVATLAGAVAAANDNDVIATIVPVIEIDTTLEVKKKIVLLSDCSGGTIIKPSASFTDLNPSKPYGLIYVNGTSNGKLTLGQTTTDENIITLDGDGRFRGIYNRVTGTTPTFESLILNSGRVTNCYDYRAGAGVYTTNKAQFVMNGGEVTGNKLDSEYADDRSLSPQGFRYYDTDYRFSRDVYAGSGARTTINDGNVGWVLQTTSVGGNGVGRTIQNGGHIDTVYVMYDNDDDPGYVGHEDNRSTTFEYNAGTVDHILMSTIDNDGYGEGNEASFKHYEVKERSFGEYKAGKHVAQLGIYGYMSLQDAYEASVNGDTILLIKNVELDDTLTIRKSIFIDDNEKYSVDPVSNLVYEIPLKITAGSESRAYNGKALTSDTYTCSGLAPGDVIGSVTITGTQTEIGKSSNVASSVVVLDASGNDVTANYVVTYEEGTLEVTDPYTNNLSNVLIILATIVISGVLGLLGSYKRVAKVQ